MPVAYHTYAGADSYDDALLWRRYGHDDRAYETNLRSALLGAIGPS